MSLIVMAVHDTEDNGRSKYTEKTIMTLNDTVNLNKHRAIIVDNGSCEKTKELIKLNWFGEVITLPENIGTAEAINLGWKLRKQGEHCIKIDNDVVIWEDDWVEKMEEIVAKDPTIGQVGLKRKDCWESPDRADFYKSTLQFLPHQAGEKWVVVEEVNHVMGTCVMHSSALLDKVGYLYQPSLYGFDDSLMSFRAKVAGFRCVFLPHIEIDHIDTGGTKYQTWKEQHATEQWNLYHQKIAEYQNNPESIYYNPYE